MLVATSTAGLLLAGWASGYPELVALALTGGASLLLGACCVLTRPDVTATRRISPPRVTEGRAVSAVLTVTNTGRRRSPPMLASEVVAGVRTAVALPGLGSGQSYRTAYPVPTARRGRYTVEPLVIGRSDPLRLFRSGRRCGERSVLYVHPKVHYLVSTPDGGARGPEGSTSSYAPRGGVAFHSLRGYEPADDWRLIHWKSTARAGTLMVRHNVVPNSPHYLVVLDTRAGCYTEASFEDAVRVAASLCVAFRVASGHGGNTVQMRTTGGRAVLERASRSGSGTTAALDLLAEAGCSPADPGLPALNQLVPESDDSVLVVVTGRPDLGQLAVLPSVRPRFRTVNLIQVGRQTVPHQ